MADNSVFITGAADGAFENALGDLPPWATQDTAESIEIILRKTLNLQTKALTQLVKTATGGDNSLDTQSVNDELLLLTKNLHNENAQDPKRRRRWREEEEEGKNRKRRNRDERDNANAKISADALLIRAGVAIKGVFEDNVKTFNDLTAAGISVINGFSSSLDGFQSLRQLTAETSVRFTELAASMAKYSSAVNSFGVGKFAKTIGMASANLTQFGFSSKESADLLGSYLSIQQNTADVNLRSASATSAGLQKFGATVFKLSMVTGMARSAIVANIESISKSTEANLLNGQIGFKAAEGVEVFLASFKDQNIAKQVLKLMTDPIKPLNETFMSLQKVGMGGFAQSFTTFSEGLKGMPEEMQAEQMKEYIKAHRGELESEKQRLAMLKQVGVEGAAASLDFITGLTQQADAIVPLTAEKRKELERTKASNKASKDLATAWEGLKSLVQRAFGPTATMLNLFTAALKLVTVPLTWLISLIDGASAALSGIVKSLGIAESIDLAAWGGLAVIAYALTRNFKILGTIVSGLGKLFKGTLFNRGVGGGPGGSGGGGPGGGDTLSKVGKGLGNLGKGIGAGLGGLLQNTLGGLANGLKALGSPKVLLGMVALAGVAASLWITGKAMQTFVNIKWDDIGKATVALVALGLAGAAAGTGALLILAGAAAFAAMGAALWIIGKAIGSTSVGISSISESISSLSGTLGAFTGLSTLQSIVQTINSIDVVKALAFGSLAKLGIISLPAPSAPSGANPLSTPKASTLSSPSQVSSKEPTTAPAGPAAPNNISSAGKENTATDTSINSALGHQTKILEQLLTSTNSLVSVNKDILKYSKLHT